MTARLIIRLARLLSWLAERVPNWHKNLFLFRAGLLQQALTVADKVELTVDAYEEAFTDGAGHHELYDWESAWFERDLPRPGSRILILAGGWGREAAVLVDQGYEVHMIEPAEQPAQAARRKLLGRVSVVVTTMQIFARYVFDDKQAALGLHHQYDAVLIGWGGLILDLKRWC